MAIRIFQFCLPRLLIVGMAATLPLAAVAQDDEVIRYEVELIAFRHNDQAGRTAETRAPEAALTADATESFVDDEPSTSVSQAASTNSRDSRRFEPLAASQLQLTSMYQRLRQLDAYSPILHTGWTQQARSTDEAIPHRIGGSGRRSQLSGNVTLYKQRFLHVNVDLSLGSGGTSGPPQDRIFGDIPTDSLRADPATQLQESRRVRRDDINYFDHPEMGVIVSVRKITSEDAADAGNQPANR